MSAENNRGAWFCGGLTAAVLCLVIAQPVAYPAQSSQAAQSKSTRQAPITLTIEDNLISLTARDASIKAILEELGRRMNIAVVAAIPPEETITTEFNRLPLKEALKKLSENHAYVTNSAEDTGRITKIMVTPARKRVVRSVSSSEALKFEFDPTEGEPK